MNEIIGPMYVPDEPEQSYTGDKPYSKALGNIIDEEARRMVQDAYKKSEQILKDNSGKLKSVSFLLYFLNLKKNHNIKTPGPWCDYDF